MLPLALAYIVVIARGDLGSSTRRASTGPVASRWRCSGVNVVLVHRCSSMLDRGRIISPASDRAAARDLQRRAGRARATAAERRLMAIGVKVLERPDRAGQLRPRDAQGHGADVQAPVRAEGDDAVSGGEEHRRLDISPRWRGTHRMLTDEEARRSASPADCVRRLPGQLHQARAGRGREGQPLSARVRDRRVPLHLLRLLPGSLPGRGDPRRAALRELGVQPRGLRLRPRAAEAQTHPVSRCGIPPTRRASDERTSSSSTSLRRLIAIVSALAVRHAQESGGRGALAGEHDVLRSPRST